jgi:hypothetical protein
MATIKTKPDTREQGSQYSMIWKSLTLANGDVLVTGFKDVWAVLISDNTKWAAGGWTVNAPTSKPYGQVTFNLGGAFTGKVVVFGR